MRARLKSYRGLRPAYRIAGEADGAKDAIPLVQSASRPWMKRALKTVVILAAILAALPFVLIIVYRFADPPMSALMLRRAIEGTGVRQQWVNLQQISPHLPLAVVVSEDVRLCQHWGVDWQAVERAVDDAQDGVEPRATSTIAMQLAKNLFLWPERSYLRKAAEIPLAYFMTLVWPERRLIEIYLNIAEWGPGIFGAGMAARYHFNKPAASLSEMEAALLAASLPNPHVRRAGRPGSRTLRIAARITARMKREAQFSACLYKKR